MATSASGAPSAAASGAGGACELADADRRWVRRALEGWELVRRDYLKLDERPLPWIVLHDASCSRDIASKIRRSVRTPGCFRAR